jgi:nucleoside-diphosphate-sugar epimerase
MKKAILVVGSHGVVGRAAIEHFTTLSDTSIIGVSRRPPEFPTTATFVPLDLRDPKACREQIAAHPEITHIVYAALHEQASVVAGWTENDHIRVNLEMLTNLLDAAEAACPALSHVTLMQGGKAYGIHLGPPKKMPSRESDRRAMPPNFYYNQEDYIKERQQGKHWSWTILRPPNVAGTSIGSPMNTILAVGVFAAISRELGLPLRFPGGEGHLIQACDARLLARSIAWAGEADTARNQVFNVTNGDVFMWEHVFAHVAGVFGMDLEPPHTMSLVQVMSGKGDVWDAIVKKHRLQPHTLTDLVPAWDFPDFSLRYKTAPFPNYMSTIKIQQAGFHECMDTEDMFVDVLRAFRTAKILP